VPPHWTGPHVGVRLVEALRVVQLLPARRGPQEYGNNWPAWLVEWQDQLAQLEQEQAERDLAHRQQNRVRVLPTATEIMRMEQAIVWPARYLRELPQLLRVVQTVAVVRMRHGHIEKAARRLGLPGRLARRWNREGLDTIAAGLRRDGVKVF
jgi:hypothetical protein